MNRKRLTVFLVMLVVYAFCAFATYAFFTNQIAAPAGVPMPDMGVPNAVLGLIAGERYMKDGLVAAAGVHFWTDVVFHVLSGLI